MKNIFKILALGTLAMSASSCKKYLDINDNPNQATSATPALVMTQAITTTAANLTGSNGYGSGVVGYTVNGGGYGGFGSLFTYNYANTEFTGLFTNNYNNNYDYQYIINQSAADATLSQFGAVARIMKAYNFQRLVDTYGDVPYTQAFRGASNLTPQYDSAPSIYQASILSIDSAITQLKANRTATAAFRGADVVFGTITGSSLTANASDEITRWIQFGQTEKLRMLVHIQGVSSLASFITAEFANFDTSIGFLTVDAIANPGYIVSSGKQNPDWDTYNLSSAGAQAGSSRVVEPSRYVFAFYSGTKISDDARGALVFANYPNAAIGALANPNNPTVASTAYGKGIFKSATQGRPLFLAAESYLLQAEANLNGRITGTAQTNFENGIKASFLYLSKDGTNNTSSDANAYLATYKAANAANRLVNYNLNTSDAQRLEAIITQKYVALNFLFGLEAWTEFRRTAYPTIVNGSNDPTLTFASPNSTSTRPDRLPVRILYPDTENSLNSQNVPTGIDVFNSRIFWDLN